MFDPKSSETIGYHLFLLPEGSFADELRGDIENLARKYGGPVFDPHVTLLARIVADGPEDVAAKARELASRLHPFEIVLDDIGAEDSFFRSLYIRAHDSEKLLHAHTEALDIFAMEDAVTYMPHASLFYGNVLAEIKSEMIESLMLPKNPRFLVNKIHVYKTEGSATEWERVAEVVLL